MLDRIDISGELPSLVASGYDLFVGYLGVDNMKEMKL